LRRRVAALAKQNSRSLTQQTELLLEAALAGDGAGVDRAAPLLDAEQVLKALVAALTERVLAVIEERKVKAPPPMRILPDGRMSRRDAARYLGYAPQTLAIWAYEGRGPRFIRVYQRCWYRKAELDAFASKITDFELSERTLRALQDIGIVAISDLFRLSEADLLRLPNFGRKSLNQLKAALEERGVDWPGHVAMRPPPAALGDPTE
jgi:hypothetical protein